MVIETILSLIIFMGFSYLLRNVLGLYEVGRPS